MQKISILLLLIIVHGWSPGQSPWETCYERSGFTKTPRYQETVDFCKKMADYSPMVHMASFGQSAQLRDIPFLIVDREGLTDPHMIHDQGKIIVLIESCIHPGESEGKDAGLMLIRDLVIFQKQTNLLDSITILFIPIFNVDGHERFGPYNRINQNGPEEMGWRVTANNLNLNRDFLKADTPEMRAWLTFFNHWLPDFFIDIHTTNGADYQYVLTYLMEIFGNMDPALTEWTKYTFLPDFISKMDIAGYPVFQYVSFRRWHDPKSGLLVSVAPPMLSQGYTSLRNRPGFLIETHMLKPYNQRVESTYQCLVTTLEILNRQAESLKTIIHDADQFVTTPEFLTQDFPLQFQTSQQDSVMVDFKGVAYSEITSDISGGTWFEYSKTPVTFSLPMFNHTLPSITVKLPFAYVVPVEWSEVIFRLALHGIDMQTLSHDTTIRITTYKFKNPQWQSSSVEGRHPMTRIEYDEITEDRIFPAGSVVIETAQPSARIIPHLLEPKGDGSLLFWGFFDPIFEQKEYAEYYVLEPMAKKMLEEDPGLKEAFEAKRISDSTFAGSQRQILYWFFERTPYWDHRRFIYPVGRIEFPDPVEKQGVAPEQNDY